MRILVLGGTVFLSRAVATEAVRRGHDVTCASRGTSGSPPDGARFVRWDRAEPVPAELAGATRPADDTFDAVVDVSGTPSQVRRAVSAFPGAHWTFVSTGNVYADTATPGGTAATSALVDPVETDEDPLSGPAVYGAMKVACENLVREGASAALVIRPGLIVGPGDPSGRFAYWPAYLAAASADGRPVLVPQDGPVQLVDVRDLAQWVVAGAERRLVGDFDAVCPSVPRSEVLAAVSDVVAGSPELVVAPTAFLDERGVKPWSGPRSIPLWIGDPAWAGFMRRDVTASLEAGLTIRPFADTAQDTLEWLSATPDATVTGLTRAEELDVLDALAGAR
ncbi:NAD-dependent epimerase/dehydratase family protein [Antribacter gilvus]|uniref:NAD-dependent epimerase/dehydratase family protein n=1 Tax=Antribacter gilvus TaxID=2304675 RepID=UPI000F799F6F|nr:NAD-dependent epimerase/dehydratase family protein [Antribacter gilvus]